MPIIKSAKKALRQNLRRRQRNLQRKDLLKDLVKRYKRQIKAGNFDEAEKLFSQVQKAADKIVKAKIIKKNKARRIKSQLAQMLVKTKSNRASS